VQSGFCLIAGQCVASGAQNGGDPCVVCDPSSSTTGWTSRSCVETLAGDGNHDDDDGPAASASFRDPTDVALGPAGQLYVADSSNHRVRLISGGQVSTLAGSTAGNEDGAALQARFNKPAGVWLGTGSAVHVADRGNNVIRVISGGTVSTLSSGSELAGPSGGTLGGAGEVLCADTFHHRVVKISSGVTSVAGVKAVAGHKDGPAAAAQFFYPMSLAVDASGTIYVVDTFNHVVRTIDGGTVKTLAGTAQTPGFADGPASSAMFRFPRGIAVDGQGVVYVGDTENHRIRMIKNGQVTTLAGTGVHGHEDGLAASATFDWPWGLDVDSAGKVYVADSENDRIRVVTP
jgi:sugar lactone lactonase YvrE